MANRSIPSIVETLAITDFKVGVDKIGLDVSIFSKFAGQLAIGNITASQFSTTVRTTSADTILYVSATGNLSYDSDGVLADGLPVSFAHLSANLTLTEDNFVLFA